jgi:hypothetical protein
MTLLQWSSGSRQSWRSLSLFRQHPAGDRVGDLGVVVIKLGIGSSSVVAALAAALVLARSRCFATRGSRPAFALARAWEAARLRDRVCPRAAV